MRLLVTGGAGFIGSNFIRYVLREHKDVQVINLDRLTYAGNLENLAEVAAGPNYALQLGDVADPADVESGFRACEEIFGGWVEAVVHFAAESHVDRSILDPSDFVRTNVLGTQVLLEAARRHHVQRFVQISTDEVYGSLGETGEFREETPLSPNSPYSASKAGADLIARAYHQTYGLPVMITRCSNNYGPYQFPEKLIPLMIAQALQDKPLPVYGDGLNVRDWLHVEDHCRAIDLVLREGRPGEVYNVGGRSEVTNLDVVRTILRVLGKPETLIRFVDDRPGHDRRYAVNTAKIERELGWLPRWGFGEGIRATVAWYVQNQGWLGRIESRSNRKQGSFS